jgi:hypothetical protein
MRKPKEEDRLRRSTLARRGLLALVETGDRLDALLAPAPRIRKGV